MTAAGLGNLPAVISAGFGIGLFEKYTGAILGTAYEVAAPVSILLTGFDLSPNSNETESAGGKMSIDKNSDLVGVALWR